jgi:hypothetical protein
LLTPCCTVGHHSPSKKKMMLKRQTYFAALVLALAPWVVVVAEDAPRKLNTTAHDEDEKTTCAYKVGLGVVTSDPLADDACAVAESYLRVLLQPCGKNGCSAVLSCAVRALDPAPSHDLAIEETGKCGSRRIEEGVDAWEDLACQRELVVELSLSSAECLGEIYNIIQGKYHQSVLLTQMLQRLGVLPCRSVVRFGAEADTVAGRFLASMSYEEAAVDNDADDEEELAAAATVHQERKLSVAGDIACRLWKSIPFVRMWNGEGLGIAG